MSVQKDQILQEKQSFTGELPEISRALINGETMLYCDTSNHVYYKKLRQQQIPTTLNYTDKKVTGVPKCFSISPGETFACTGYEDGKIVVFKPNITDTKQELAPTVTDTKLGAINSIEFVDKDTFLYTNGTAVYKKSVNTFNQLFSATKLMAMQDKPIFEQHEKIIKIFIPPIFKGTTIFYQQLKDIVCTLSSENVKFYKIGEKTPFLFSIPTIGCFAFGSASETTFTYAVVDQEDGKYYGKIYDYLTHENPKAKFEIPFKPQLVSFFSDTIVAFVKEFEPEDKQATIYIIDSTTNKTEVIHTLRGIYTPSTDFIYCINDKKLFELRLLSFRDQVLNFAGDPDKACEYCHKAYNGDPWSIIGLSRNEDYRRLQIEKELARILVQKCETDLKADTSKATEIIEDIIKRWKSMNMKNAITNEFMAPFEENGKIAEYFQAIMKADPTASEFVYKKQFVTKLLNIKELEGYNEFILQLPDLIAPTALILKAACENNNVELMYKIYLERLNDVISAFNILACNNRYEKIIEIYNSRYEGTLELTTNEVKWLLAISQDGKHFPRLTEIVKQDVSIVASLLSVIMEIIRSKDMVPPAQFANAVIVAIHDANLPPSHDLFKVVLQFARTSGMEIFGSSLSILLPLIFSDEMNPRKNANKKLENRETFIEILCEIIKMDKISIETKKSLIPLCEAFGFIQAKRAILSSARMYSQLITFEITEESNIKADVFEDVMSIYKQNPSNKADLQKAILENLSLLISKDITKLITMIKEIFEPEKDPNYSLENLVKSISDDRMKNYFIREYVKRTKSAMIPANYSESYINFLCQYYPNEVRDFIDRTPNPSEYIKLCRQEKIYDACAIIDTKASFMLNKFCEDITNYFDEMSMRYVDKKDNIETLQNNIKFIVSIFDRNQGVHYEESKKAFADAVRSVVRSWAIPIYAANAAKLDISALQEGLKKFCIAGYAFVPFHELLTIIVGEYGELSIGLLRSTLIELVQDYSYDVDTSASLTDLITDNEIDAYNKYISASTKGVEFEGRQCAACAKLLTEGLSVTVYPCGHIFHSGCSTRPKCPKCFETDIYEKQETSQKTLNTTTINRKLAKFEADLLIRQDEDILANDESSKVQIVISPNNIVKLV